MTHELQVVGLHTPEGRAAVRNAGRPIVNKKTGQVSFVTPRGLRINSALRKDEWEELDRQVVAEAVAPLNIVRALDQRGLVRRLGSIGTLVAQYNQVSQLTAANVSLRGHASGEKDLVDFDIVGVPVPVIFKEFEIDERVLQSSRMLGDGIDMVNARAAARVVAEQVESIAIDGASGINLNGSSISGLTSHADINTDTATNYGGGDWGTITNVLPTIAGMIAAAKTDNYYGPYGIWAATTQYNQATLAYFTDGSGDTPRDRILRLPMVEFFDESPGLADGEVLLVTLSAEVVELAYVSQYWPITNIEWQSGDMMLNQFKVMTVFTPIVKSTHAGRSGIVLASAA